MQPASKYRLSKRFESIVPAVKTSPVSSAKLKSLNVNETPVKMVQNVMFFKKIRDVNACRIRPVNFVRNRVNRDSLLTKTASVTDVIWVII